MTDERDTQERDEIVEDLRIIASAAVAELRERLIPSPAQWARAQALREAREWVEATAAGPYAIVDGALVTEASSSLVEQLALRWARLIESGQMPGGVER